MGTKHRMSSRRSASATCACSIRGCICEAQYVFVYVLNKKGLRERGNGRGRRRGWAEREHASRRADPRHSGQQDDGDEKCRFPVVAMQVDHEHRTDAAKYDRGRCYIPHRDPRAVGVGRHNELHLLEP